MIDSDKALLPVAIFDSGVGGLTVAKALKEHLPHESIVYLADTASRPFGTKTEKELKAIIEKNCEFLASIPLKMLVIACHTACSLGLEIYNSLDIPVMGITGSSFSTLHSLNHQQPKIILGTERTIRSSIYQNFLCSHGLDTNALFHPCSSIEQMIETQVSDPGIILKELERSLHTIAQVKNAQVLLACTHFPIYSSFIQQVLDPSATLIDPAGDFVRSIADTLATLSLVNPLSTSEDLYLVTHDTQTFRNKFFTYFSPDTWKNKSFF